MATIFTPWGGAVNCSSSKDCIANALPSGNPGDLSTCVTFSGDNLPDWVPLDQPVCSCNINYGRKGMGCKDLDEKNTLFMVLLIPNILLNLYTTFYLVKTGVVAYKLGLTNSGVNKITLVLLFLSNVIASAWPLVRLWLYAGAPAWVYDFNLVCASLCATVVVVLLLALTLLFRQVLNSANKVRNGTYSGISQKEKILVSSASAVVVATMSMLTLSGHNQRAAQATVVFFLGSFILYLHAASKMKQLIINSCAQAPDETQPSSEMLRAAVTRIQKCIYRVMAFILWYIPFALLYSFTTTDQKSSSISTNTIAALALESLHFSVSFCVFWIAQYSSEPILSKRYSVSSVTKVTSHPRRSDLPTISASRTTLPP